MEILIWNVATAMYAMPWPILLIIEADRHAYINSYENIHYGISILVIRVYTVHVK